MLTERCCKECGNIKPISKFSKNSKSLDGYLLICCKCHYIKYKRPRKYVYKYISTEKRNNARFGGNRTKALERDGFKCVMCLMTSEQHKSLFGCELSVDHIDGQGCYSNVKNHEMSNLQTLCFPCHGRKDATRGHQIRRAANGVNV